jgi:cytochrome c peroxidase
MPNTMTATAVLARFLLLGISVVLLGAQCGDDDDGPAVVFSAAESSQMQLLANLPAVPASPTNAFANSAAAAALGKQYYFDARFSGPLTHSDNTIAPSGNGVPGQTSRISCSRCHNPSTGFSDQRSVPDDTSLGASFTGRNAPTLYNVAYQTWYFWDGRKDSLWSQALGPTESSIEHDGNRVAFAMVIRDHYASLHGAVFGPLPVELNDLGTTYPFPAPPAAPDFPLQGRPGAGPTAGGFANYDALPAGHKLAVNRVFADFGKSIEAYERLIVSRNSRFDQFVASGSVSGLSLSEQNGLKIFLGKGRCILCHSGPNFTDNAFHNIGVAQAGLHVPAGDNGRFDGIPQVVADPFNGIGVFSDNAAAGATKLSGVVTDPSQLGQFKTPTLRSIGETGPYMHTGQIKTLRDVIVFYNAGGDPSGFVGTRQLIPLGLTPSEIDDLTAFLLTLDGEELPASVTSTPVLPP